MKKIRQKIPFLLLIIVGLSAILFFSGTGSPIRDEMTDATSAFHVSYYNLKGISEDSVASTYDFSYLPDVSMLVLEDNNQDAEINYKVEGAERVTVQFYSSYGSFAFRFPNNAMGQHYMVPSATQSFLDMPVYRGSQHLYLKDNDGIIYKCDKMTGMLAKLKFTPTTLPAGESIESYPILGASLDASTDGMVFSATDVLSREANIYTDTVNPDFPRMFLHTMTFQIPEGTKQLRLNFKDLLGIKEVNDLGTVPFSAISSVVFEGASVSLAVEETSEPSTPESGTESSIITESSAPAPTESSTNPLPESSMVDVSSGESGTESYPSGVTVTYGTMDGEQEYTAWRNSRNFKHSYDNNFGRAVRQKTKLVTGENNFATIISVNRQTPPERPESSLERIDVENVVTNSQLGDKEEEKDDSSGIYFLLGSCILSLIAVVGTYIFTYWRAQNKNDESY